MKITTITPPTTNVLFHGLFQSNLLYREYHKKNTNSNSICGFYSFAAVFIHVAILVVAFAVVVFLIIISVFYLNISLPAIEKGYRNFLPHDNAKK